MISGSTFKIFASAQKECNKTAWKEIMKASGGAITTNPFEEDVNKNF
jgi:hypothetical protein